MEISDSEISGKAGFISFQLQKGRITHTDWSLRINVNDQFRDWIDEMSKVELLSVSIFDLDTSILHHQRLRLPCPPVLGA
jgi:hypothetical protein